LASGRRWLPASRQVRSFLTYFGTWACIGLLFGITDAYASGLSVVPTALQTSLGFVLVCAFLAAAGPAQVAELSYRRLLLRCLSAGMLLGLFGALWRESKAGRALWPNCLWGLAIGFLLGGSLAGVAVLYKLIKSLVSAGLEQRPGATEPEQSRPEGLRWHRVDWHILQGAAVGGLIGLFLGYHLADVTGLEAGPTCLASLPVGAIVAAIGRARRTEQFGFWVLIVLNLAFFLLVVYRFARRDDWSLVRTYGPILVGANAILLALLVGTALLKLFGWGKAEPGDAWPSFLVFSLLLGGVASCLSPAIAGGQIGFELGGPIGRGTGETLGALLGPVLLVTLFMLCFGPMTLKTGPNLWQARHWLGYVVLGVANAGVVWLLVR
jgi:hypothetical protein